MLLLSSHDVERTCRETDVVGAVREALILHAAGDTRLAPEAYMAWDAPGGGRARTLNMPGFVGGAVNAVGTKIINGNPANIERDIPRASGVTALFDRDTARIICLMDGAFISARRTAAVSELCVEKLHVAAPVCLGVCGAGYLALHHVEALAHRMGLERLLVYDLHRERAEALCARAMAAELCPRAAVADTAAELGRQSTCIVAATTTTTPYIDYEMIAPGTVLLNISLDDFAADVFLRADKLYVDDWALITADQNRLLGRLARDRLVVDPRRSASGGPAAGPRAIEGTIGELLAGICLGREREGEIILVNPFGMAIEDIAVAKAVYDRALAMNIGQRIMEESRRSAIWATASPKRPRWRPEVMHRMKAETASELRGMDRPQFLSHPVHVLFENQVSRTPHAVALQTVDQTLSYEALDLRAMRLAARVAAAGCEPGSGVGLLVDRSVDMVTAMLAAMKTGTFFVPLDRTLPDQRLRTMVEKTNARIILAQPHYIERAATIVAPGTEILPLSEAEDNGSVKSVHRTVSPDAPVYVMFTSGSTGTPKGVMVPHKSVASRLLWMAEAGLMQPDDRVLQRTPFAFDASIWKSSHRLSSVPGFA